MRRWALEKLALVIAIAMQSPLGATPTHGQEWPAKPIRFVIPFPPGGGTDILSRVIAQRITTQAKWSFLLDNKPGVGGGLGLEQAARAAPDGYTIVMGQTSNLAINPTLHAKLAYDPVKDFQAVSLVASGPLLLVAGASGRISSLQSLVETAKAEPGRVLFGSPGNGTLGHLGAELFAQAVGIKLEHIPYRGAAQALTDVLGGRLDLYSSTIPAALGHIKGGRLRGIAVMGLTRLPELPDVPTLAESGAPRFEVANWYGVLVPAATPAPIVARLGEEVRSALASAEVREKLAAEGVAPQPGTPEAFAALIKAEIAKWAPVVRASGLKLE